MHWNLKLEKQTPKLKKHLFNSGTIVVKLEVNEASACMPSLSLSYVTTTSLPSVSSIAPSS
jgi:hypothetical protein